jgi:hypothetical protein
LGHLEVLATLAISSPLNHLMSITKVLAKSINLTDFDFSVEQSRFTSAEPHDGSVTIRLPGKNRKTANHELLFIPYFKKYNLKFKTVAIGKNKDKAKAPIVVFDQHSLASENATIRKYGDTTGFINSKGHALKILDIFDINLRGRPDEVIKLYFKLQPTVISRNKLDYRICIISAMKVIKNDGKIQIKRKPLKRRLKNPEEGSTEKASKTITPNII